MQGRTSSGFEVIGGKGEGKRKSSHDDPLVIRSERLAEIILPYIQSIDDSIRMKTAEDGILGGWEVTAMQIGTDASNLRKTLFRNDWVGYGKADAWLTALDLQHLMSSLHPVPNPQWNTEKWMRWKLSEAGCETDQGYKISMGGSRKTGVGLN
jgi:hypothetical protein